MKLTGSRIKLMAMCGVALASGIVTFRAQADEWDKKTIFTIDQPIQVTDTYLEPGTYVLKLANSSSDRHIVQIYNRDQNHLIDTVMAIPNYRLQPSGNSRFIFWETPAGSARALRAWFYPGDNFGQEFRYPKHLHEIAQVQVRTAPAPTPVVPEVAVAQEPPPAPVVTPAPEPAPQAAVQEQAPVEIAQNTPPPAAPEPPPTVEQTTPPPPAALPKTASPYPLIGLGGIAALGLSALLRVRRLAHNN